MSLLPPLSAKQYQHLAELFQPESEYYRIYSDAPAKPKTGQLLLMREPYSSQIKIHYPSGDYKLIQYSETTISELVALGVPKEKVEHTLDYVWNFGKVYVGTTNKELFAPQLVSMD